MRFFAVLALMAVASVSVSGVSARAINKNSNAKSNGKAVAASASNSTASATSASSSAASSNASSTDSAASATRTRPCDQGDQSLASGLNAAVTIGIGQQASVVTLQGTNNSADFTTGVTRLQQFVDTMSLQLQMAQAIADDASFAQTQLKLLAASQTSQADAVKALTGDAQTDASALTSLAQSFLDSTNNAQDGAEQALIDCFLPLNAVSG